MPGEDGAVGHNFRPVERDQQFLLPPSVRDWLPEDDLAWVVLDAVDQLDLSAIRSRYRADGHGAPAYDPVLMVGLLLYAYAQGERSSRTIEARCRRDLGYRVVAANQVPDHATIARFRADHETAIADLFGQVLALCLAAGLGQLGLIALDGTKLAAATSRRANRTAAELDAEIAAMLAEAARVDAAEDAAHGADRRGDELPAALARRADRLDRFREARRQLAEAADAAGPVPPGGTRRPRAIDPDRPAGSGRPTTTAGRKRGWMSRNTTDPDSRPMHAATGWIQGYNAQLAVAEDGLIVAAEIADSSADYGQLVPMVETIRANLAGAGSRQRVGTFLADAGYWSERNVATVEATGFARLLVAPDAGGPRRPGSAAPRRAGRERMRRRLRHPANRARYRRRSVIVEPVFGQIKAARGFRQLSRRGRVAAHSEWRLIAMTQNLLRLWRTGRAHRPDGPPDDPGPRQAPRIRAGVRRPGIHPGSPCRA
jgi:transposase